MANTSLSLIIFALVTTLLINQTLSQPAAPAPAPAGPINLTAILEKGGQFTTFMHLLTTTQAVIQINSQLNSSREGLTVFSPTDNAFKNLKSGALNNLTVQGQVQLVLSHVLPAYYTLTDLLSVPNPVRTQASGQDGGFFGLNFTGQGTQVNVSSGVVATQVSNALRDLYPLAVYSVDKVLLPEELFGDKPLVKPGAPPPKPSEGTNVTADASKGKAANDKSGVEEINVGLGFVVGLALLVAKVIF